MPEWKTVNEYGYDNYEVSSTGQVRNKKTGRILKPRPTKKGKKGYLLVALFKNGKRIDRLIHRLVLQAFVGPCLTGLQSNHKDGDKKINHVYNLEWVTPSENQKHAYDTGLKSAPVGQNHHMYGKKHKEESIEKMRKSKEGLYVGEKHPLTKLSEKDVISIRKMVKEGIKQTEIAKLKDIKPSAVNKIVKRRTWKHVK